VCSHQGNLEAISHILPLHPTVAATYSSEPPESNHRMHQTRSNACCTLCDYCIVTLAVRTGGSRTVLDISNLRAARCGLRPLPLTASDNQDPGLSESQHRQGPSPMVPQASQRPLSSRFAPLFPAPTGAPSKLPATSLPSFLPSPTHRQSDQEIWAAFPHLPRVPDGPQTFPEPPSAQIWHPCTGCDRGRGCGHLPVTSGTVPEAPSHAVPMPRPRYFAICQQRSAS